MAYISNCAEFHVLFRAALELNCTFCPIVGSFFFFFLFFSACFSLMLDRNISMYTCSVLMLLTLL